MRNFRKKWGSLGRKGDLDGDGGSSGEIVLSTAQRRQMFNEASLIFFTLVNPFTAETPINIEYKIFRTLQNTFANVEFDPYMPEKPRSTQRAPQPPVPKDNVVCPWEDVFDRPTSIDSTGSEASSSMSARNIVPSDFGEDVFDAAFESIKYLVFTNTWPRYVEAELGMGKAGSGSVSP